MGDFERALARTETDALETLRAAEAVVKASKQLVAAAKVGDVAALERALAETKRTISALGVQQRNAQEGWVFDVIEYVRDGGYRQELKEAAAAAQLPLFEQEGRLFSYPVLLRIVSGATTTDLGVTIDRKKTRSIRPSFLAALLKRASTQPPKFKSDSFLDALYKAYRIAEQELKARNPGVQPNPMVELIRLYELLTLFPGQQREYGRQEFARDLYLLDQGPLKEVQKHRFRLAAATGTKGSASRLLNLVDRAGQERVYYAIAFEPAQ